MDFFAILFSFQVCSAVHWFQNFPYPGTVEHVVHPRKCQGVQTGMDKCPPNPYFPLQYSPMSKVTDFQWLKMQEDPKSLPPGEVPRQLQLYAEGVMVDQMKPGDQVDIIGTLLTRRGPGKTGVKLPFVKIHGISSQNKGPVTTAWSEEEEEKYKKFARQNDVLGILGWSRFPKNFQIHLKLFPLCFSFCAFLMVGPENLMKKVIYQSLYTPADIGEIKGGDGEELKFGP